MIVIALFLHIPDPRVYGPGQIGTQDQATTMSRTGKKRSALVADKRYSGGKPGPKGAAGAPPQNGRRSARKSRSPRRRRGLLGYLLLPFAFLANLAWRLLWRGAFVVAVLILAAVGYVYTTLPPAVSLLDGRARGSVTMLDRNGEVFAWRGQQFGGAITTDTVSPHLKNAVVATEDRRFYSHIGVDPRGIASAVRINLSEGRGPLSGNGGSTITQQTAKLLCLGVPYDPTSGISEAEYEADCRRTTIWRKVKEAIYSMAMEAKYSKDDILTIYFNRAYLGAGTRGFEAASQRYFGKSAAEVDPAEAAMLAGLLVAPTRYAPTNNLERSQQRAGLIIGLMRDQGYLTKAEADYALNNPATLSQAADEEAGGYFADWVMDSGPNFLTRDTTEDVIINTTFDPRIQSAAETALANVLDDNPEKSSDAEAAIVVMSADGAVRAMVGGRRTKVTGAFNRATQSKRQTGSAFKPFVYAAALDLGLTPLSTVDDEPLTINIPGSGPWTPKNYDGKFRGRITLTEALQKSLNIPAVRVSETVGRENVRKVASDFGIQSDLADGPALALGASGSSLLEMTGAYAGILNGGRSVVPYGLTQLRIVGDDRALMDQTGGMGERVISEGAAQDLIYMMNKVAESGTARRANLDDREVAGKTGTTQANRDAWFLGFTADYVAGVWMGYDDNKPLKGVTGGGLPATIWHELMIRVSEGMPARPLPMREPTPPEAQIASDGTVPLTTERTTESQPHRDAENTQPRRRQPSGGEIAERVIREVLGRILGGN